MAVEITIGFRRESKRADLKGFQNTDAACSLHALPILVSLASESRKVMVAGALRCIGIISMTILWIRRTLDIPSFNPICYSLHGSDLLSKCSNLVLQGSLLGLFRVMAMSITKVFKLFLLVRNEVTISFCGVISVLNLAFLGVTFSSLSMRIYN